MKTRKKKLYIWGGFIGVVIVGIILGVLSVNTSVSAKPVLTVSIQPQRYFLEKIAGDKYDVLCLLTQGANPESYEPSFSHLINLEKSKAYFCMGNIGFELAILNRVKNNNPDLRIINTSEGLDLLRGTHEGHSSSHDGHKHSHEIDPHVWTSVVNAKIIVQNMYKAMVELDPQNKKYYTTNYNVLFAELLELEQELGKQLSESKGKAFVIWHPSLSYFARDYGLTQIAIESEGKEIPASVLKEKIDKARENNVKVLFVQKEFDNRQVQTVNEQLGVKQIEINPMNYDWADEMKLIANAIAE